MVDLPITKWIKKKIRRLIGIVEDTDVATHSIASGKYVIWKGDLYKSTAAIAVGGSLSLSNLSPVSDGGLNELSEQIGTVDGNKQNKLIRRSAQSSPGSQYAEITVNSDEYLVGGYGIFFPVAFEYNPSTAKWYAYSVVSIGGGDTLTVHYYVYSA